jgi:DNA-binding MarR family transcriptional regulator
LVVGRTLKDPQVATSTATPSGNPIPDITDILDPLERRAWRAYVVSHARLVHRLEAGLLARSGLPLAEFDVLHQLSVATDQRLRMNELADRVLLSRAGITRLVDRLVEDGLVARAKCPSDARGSFAVLTPAGRKRVEDARPEHLADVRRFFLDHFTREELETLADLFDREIAAT